MLVNGVQQPIDAQGTEPVILADTTLVPVRAVIEALGGSIVWNASARSVDAILGDCSVLAGIGGNVAYVNGKAVAIDATNPAVVPVITNGRTMLPLRFVAESLGIDVEYDATSKMITLTYAIGTTPVAGMLIPYRKGDKWGFCDRNKNMVIPAVYDDTYLFSGGLAEVKVNNKYGFIDTLSLIHI